MVVENLFLFNRDEIFRIGNLLYADYFMFCILVGIILLIAAIGAITLTFDVARYNVECNKYSVSVRSFRLVGKQQRLMDLESKKVYH